MADWTVSGTYVEACNCEAVCPCVVFSPPTEGDCTAILGWRIAQGRFGATSLTGLNVALMAHADGNMKDGNWKVALYTDERADEQQREALEAIFSGAAGGHLANLGPLIGQVLGARPAKIEIDGVGRRFRLEVAGAASAEIETIEGQGGEPVRISGHPLAPVPGVPFTVARSQRFRYGDHGLACDVSGRNGFVTEFTYRS